MQSAWQARSVNRLADETSPYLLQHADNPVDWYPWGEEALGRARDENRPILLSIGYAACHWCHVMEHESFEDASTAAVMNEHFVNVKVDREERPDLDAVYMEAVVALSGHGGWPMTVFLTPAGEPFYGGTYYPPEPRHGLPSFRQLLDSIAEAWRDRRDDVSRAAAQLVEAVRHSAELRPSTDPLTEAVLSAAARNLGATFEPTYGGWGQAPKFPNAPTLEFLLRRDDDAARAMVVKTLDEMAAGGMYDLLGGGFHRYSVDDRWLVPHFEKMLYDNALLAATYLHGWLVTGTERYREISSETIEYLLRELLLPEGGFASAQDADTDGVEGLTFTWTEDESVPAGLLEPFEHGRSIIRGDVDEETRARLFAIREQRPKPLRDDKAIASWNGLALAALAEAGRRLDRPDWLDAARRLGEFLLGPLTGRDGVCGGAFATAAPVGTAISTTTRTSLTGCSSCTSRRASCVGSGRPAGSRSWRSSSSPTRSMAASSSRPPTASSSLRGRKSWTTTRSLRQLDARARPAPARADLRRRRSGAARGLGAPAPSASSGARAVRVRLGARRARPAPEPAARARDRRADRVRDRARGARAVAAADGRGGRSSRGRAAPRRQGPRRRRAPVYVCERFSCRAPVTDPALL